MPTRDEIEAWRKRDDAEPEGEEVSEWLIAVVYVVAREINTLRDLHGLAPRTKAQVFNAIRTAKADLTVD